MPKISADDIGRMDKRFRVQFATSLPGAKPMCLVGTVDERGATNLAPFSSILHLGSNPCLLGMVSRPDSVERHSLANIRATGCWTINHVHAGMVDAAHQCSARYPREVSEFDATGLGVLLEEGFPAPFVAESGFRIGLVLEEIVPVASNGTLLIVGRVEAVHIPEGALRDDGAVDLSAAGCVASHALDSYLTLAPLARLAYAKPGIPPKRL